MWKIFLRHGTRPPSWPFSRINCRRFCLGAIDRSSFSRHAFSESDDTSNFYAESLLFRGRNLHAALCDYPSTAISNSLCPSLCFISFYVTLIYRGLLFVSNNDHWIPRSNVTGQATRNNARQIDERNDICRESK